MPHLTEFIQSGEAIPYQHPVFQEIHQIAKRTKVLTVALNNATDEVAVRAILSEITGQDIDPTTTVFTPIHINLGTRTRIGKGVFINFDCCLLDIGGITIEDNVQIGPNVKICSEGHPLEPARRKDLIVKPVLIKRNAWIGAGAIILPGVTIGENAVIAAGAVVNRDVPDNTVVAGIPAKIIKTI